MPIALPATMSVRLMTPPAQIWRLANRLSAVDGGVTFNGKT